MEKDLKVLVLEDVEEDMELITRSLLKAGMNVDARRVDTREEFIEAISQSPVDVILSDHSLPQFNSHEALKLCRSHGLNIPFILVTGTVSEEFAVKSLKMGADNYVLKSNLARLPSAINNALKQKGDEDARSTANDALLVQNEELRKINRELDSFVYSVSHNLKAPLMSVLGLINIARMEDQKNGNVFQSYFDMMEKSVHKLDDTLKEILEYSRNARKELVINEVDIAQIIADNLERMQYLAGSEKIRKDVNINATAPFISDAYRMSVIFNNLVSNAIKYSDQSKEDPFLEINVDINEERGLFIVKDNGMGIPKEFVNRVFEMFFRATAEKEGAGLGLYIVKETVEKLHGVIQVDSEPRVGTTFRIEIPNFETFRPDSNEVN